jgi:hypothetical protein
MSDIDLVNALFALLLSNNERAFLNQLKYNPDALEAKNKLLILLEKKGDYASVERILKVIQQSETLASPIS